MKDAAYRIDSIGSPLQLIYRLVDGGRIIEAVRPARQILRRWWEDRGGREPTPATVLEAFKRRDELYLPAVLTVADDDIVGWS